MDVQGTLQGEGEISIQTVSSVVVRPIVVSLNQCRSFETVYALFNHIISSEISFLWTQCQVKIMCC